MSTKIYKICTDFIKSQNFISNGREQQEMIAITSLPQMLAKGQQRRQRIQSVICCENQVTIAVAILSCYHPWFSQCSANVESKGFFLSDTKKKPRATNPSISRLPHCLAVQTVANISQLKASLYTITVFEKTSNDLSPRHDICTFSIVNSWLRYLFTQICCLQNKTVAENQQCEAVPLTLEADIFTDIPTYFVKIASSFSRIIGEKNSIKLNDSLWYLVIPLAYTGESYAFELSFMLCFKFFHLSARNKIIYGIHKKGVF